MSVFEFLKDACLLRFSIRVLQEVIRLWARRARGNLAYLRHVEVLLGDGGEYTLEPFDATFINVGITYRRGVWLDSVR